MIILPFPPKELSPNARSRTYHKQARFKKQARADGYYATKASKASVAAGDVPVMMEVSFYPPGAYHYDQDGLISRMKGYLDGIADALGVDDYHFRPEYRFCAPDGKARVTVEIITGEARPFGEIAAEIVERLRPMEDAA